MVILSPVGMAALRAEANQCVLTVGLEKVPGYPSLVFAPTNSLHFQGTQHV